MLVTCIFLVGGERVFEHTGDGYGGRTDGGTSRPAPRVRRRGGRGRGLGHNNIIIIKQCNTLLFQTLRTSSRSIHAMSSIKRIGV